MHDGRKYFLLLVDDATRFMSLRLLLGKDEAAEAIKQFQVKVEAETGCKLKVLCTDRGGEFTSMEFGRRGEASHGAVFTAAKRRRGEAQPNRGFMARSMLKAKKMPAELWGEAVSTAVFILNKAPTKSLKRVTPFEVWHGRKPDVALMRTFRCVGRMKDVKPHLSKLEDRSTPMVFLGYKHGSKGVQDVRSAGGAGTHFRGTSYSARARAGAGRRQALRKLELCQSAYALKLLERAGLKGCNPTQVPMQEKPKLSKNSTEEKVDATLYRSLIGGLRYLTHTRPDISFAVGYVSRFMEDPHKDHMAAVKHLLRYIAGSCELGLAYPWRKKNSDLHLIGFSDSDMGGDLDGRKSTSGMVFFLETCPISWQSQKQKILALSTSACQGVWLRRLLEEITGQPVAAPILRIDNHSAIELAKNPVLHSRSKHIDIKFHFIRDCGEEAACGCVHKPLGKKKFEEMKTQPALRSSSEPQPQTRAHRLPPPPPRQTPPSPLLSSPLGLWPRWLGSQPAVMLAYAAALLAQPSAWAFPVQHRPPLSPVSIDWIAESGASYHTTPDTTILSSIRPPHPSCPSTIMVGKGSCLPVTSVGNAVTHGPFRLVAPHMVHNLLSIRQFTTDNSCSVEFDSFGLNVKDLASRRPILRCDSSGPLYTLRFPPSATPSPFPSHSSSAAFATTTSSTTWHVLVTPAATPWLSLVVAQPSLALRLLMSISVTLASWGATFVYLFLLLPMRLISLISFTVTCGRLLSPAFLGTNTIWWCWMTFLTILEPFLCAPSLMRSPRSPTSSPGCLLSSASPLRAVQCDNGREFDNDACRSFFLSRGVQLRMSCPYTSAQNGKAERMIRTTNDVMRTVLFQASLCARFWAENLHTATYLLNRLPFTASPAPTPHNALFGTPPRYDHLRVFGCACYPNTSATASHKLTPRSTRCVFLVCSPDHKGYRCFDLTSRWVLISRHVVFDESNIPFSTTSSPASDLELESLFPIDPVVQSPMSERSAGPPPACFPSVPCVGLSPPIAPRATPDAPSSPAAPRAAPEAPSLPAAPCAAPAPPARYAQPVRVYQRRLVLSLALAPPPSESPFRTMDNICDTSPPGQAVRNLDGELFMASAEEPHSLEEAEADTRWRRAMEEMASIEEIKIWELPIGLMWVYKVKKNERGDVVKRKARLVAKGFMQREGIDFEVFTLVTQMDSVRLLLALAAMRDWSVQIHHLDVKSAFLNGELTEVVHMQQPPGFVVAGKEGKLDSTLATLGFKKCALEHALYTQRSKEGILIVGVYVHDLIVTGSEQQEIKNFKSEMAAKFKMSDLALLSYYLGIEVRQRKHGIELCQSAYALKLLERAGLKGCNPTQVPMQEKPELSNNRTDEKVDATRYRSFIMAERAPQARLWLSQPVRQSTLLVQLQHVMERLLEEVTGQAVAAPILRIDNKSAIEEQAQAVAKRAYDRGHRELQFAVGDWVMLRIRHRAPASLPQPARGKLRPKFYGPYRVTAVINKAAYRLALPPNARIHDVFHVGLLKPFKGTPPAAPPALPPMHHGVAQPAPARAVKVRLAHGVHQVLVHWADQPASAAMWEDLHTFQERYPHFQLEDKLLVEKGRDVMWGKSYGRRTARRADQSSG
ncbi:hypothetical protein U9M48_031418 [Paspalum notatum var. saurae]|uniref:Integrase catalytic domain-containing protein n=1 Tax=Paspalum notatum var. saurae TaxID=547442 RepID=A0AAQ3U6U3_PASNO